MRKQILIAIAIVPLLLSWSRASQRWLMDSSQPYGIPSEDSGTSSYLGVDIADITADRLGALKLKEEKGVEITMVDQDAPAGRAGLREHDVILNMNGTAIESKVQLQRMIHETPAGRVVTLGLSRDGQPITIKVQLGDRSKEFGKMSPMDKDWNVQIPPIPNIPDFDVPNIAVMYVHSSMRSGLMVENLTPQLGEFFGAKNGNGVLVRSVEKGSRAARGGMRAGDVIVRVGDQEIHDTGDFTRALHTHGSGSVNVGVIRDRKEQTLTITLPERKDSGEMIEESFEEPELDAETQAAIFEVQDEIAKLRPQFELAQAESRKASKEVRKYACEGQKQAIEQAEKLEREIKPEVEKKLDQNSKKLQRKMEQLRRQMQGEWLEI
ncbi:MAG: PDZ domain-containing protein [Candidatus Sulfotelmatobacter sp.]